MKKRSPVAVLLLPFITFGFYSLYWLVATKGELNTQGAKIPTAWLLIVPIVNIWWLWKYSEGVENVTKEKPSGVVAFILLFLLGFIGQAIVQSDYNKLDAAPVSVGPQVAAPAAPAEPAAPAPAAPVTPVVTPAAAAPAATPATDTTPKQPLVQ
jgi:hypothetical protein